MIAAAFLLAAAGIFPAFQPGPAPACRPLLWDAPVSWSAPEPRRPRVRFSPAGAQAVARAQALSAEAGPGKAAESLKNSREPEVLLVRAELLAAEGDLDQARRAFEAVLKTKNNTAPRALALAGYKKVLRRGIEEGRKNWVRPLIQCLKDEWLNEEALNLLPAIAADPGLPEDDREYLRRQEPIMALRLGRYDRAVELWSRPRDNSELQWLSQAERRRGNFVRAAELRVESAGKLRPGRARTRELFTAFTVLAKAGLAAESSALAEAYPEIKREGDYLWLAGLAALAAGDSAGAEDHFKKILADARLKKRHSGAGYFLARGLEAAGRGPEAAAAYARVAAEPFSYYQILARGRTEEGGRRSLGAAFSRLLESGPSGLDRHSLGFHQWVTEKGLSEAALEDGAARLAESGRIFPENKLNALAVGLLARRDWPGLARLISDEPAAVRQPLAPARELWLPLAATVAARQGDYRAAVSLFSRVPGGSSPGLKGWSHPLIYSRPVLAAYREHGLPPSWLLALIRAESAFQPDIMSASNARGLMQLLPATAAKVAAILGEEEPGATDLFEPEMNIRYGSWYLKALWDGFGHPALALAGYNGGPYNIKSLILAKPGMPLDVFIEFLPFEETANYVKRITESRYIYETVYLGQADLPDLTAPVVPPQPSLPEF